MDEPTKNPVGRPTKYAPEWMIPMILDGFQVGMSKLEAAHSIGITQETMRVWCAEYPEFSAAVKTGVEMSNAWWEREGRGALRDDKYNNTMWIFNMKNRFGWRDKQEVTGDPEKPVAIYHTVDAVGLDELRDAFAKAKGTES